MTYNYSKQLKNLFFDIPGTGEPRPHKGPNYVVLSGCPVIFKFSIKKQRISSVTVSSMLNRIYFKKII